MEELLQLLSDEPLGTGATLSGGANMKLLPRY